MKRHLSPLLAAALAACSLALDARAESLSEYCASKGMVPDGVEGSGEWGCKPRGDGGSSGYDDGGAARRAALRAAQEAAAAQRQREENERKRKRREAQLEFDRKKAEALGEVKELGSDDLELKGLDDDGASGNRGGAPTRGMRPVLRNQVTPNLQLKGLLDEPEPKPKACRIVDTCMKALEEQEKALEQARLDQKDLYMAMGSADFKHGLEFLDAAIKEGRVEPDMPRLYVYKSAKQPSLYYSVDQYRVSFDDIMKHLHSLRVAYGGGGKGPQPQEAAEIIKKKAKKELTAQAHEKVQATALEEAEKLVAKRLKGELDADVKNSEMALAYGDYLRRMMQCGDGRNEDYGACAKAAERFIDKFAKVALERMNMGATQARLDAFSKAYRGYTDNALRRAQATALAASKCIEGCRR